jgi:predicted ArsR family transcriptional regulator
MQREAIPDDVVRFINEKVDSVPHLEALLLLYDSTPREWTAQEVAVRVYVPEDHARFILQDLIRQRLVTDGAEGGEHYRYDIAWDVTGSTMRKVAEAYRKHLVRVANLIHSKASAAVRDFARAFQFKKKEP